MTDTSVVERRRRARELGRCGRIREAIALLRPLVQAAPNRDDHAHDHPDGRVASTLQDNHTSDFPGLGAQGHPDTDFSRAQRDDVGQHTI